MFDLSAGPPDPRDVRVTFSGAITWREGSLILRVLVEDSTGADGCEVDCRVSRRTAASHPLDARSVENALAEFIDDSWPPEYRLDAVRAVADSGGEYLLGGTAELGLYVTAPPAELAA